jgi:hypothetical protein
MTRRLRLAVLALASTVALVACGGGGGSPGATGAAAGTGTTTPVVAAPTVTMAVVDGTGAAISSLSGGQSATIKATVLTADGKPAVGAIVQFAAATTGLIVFTPDTGSALTDSKGVAVITVKPASVTAAGAVSVTATAVVAGVTTTSTTGISIGAAPLTVGALSFATAPTGSLSAFSTLTLNIPVTSGGAAVTTAPGLVLSSLCTGDGTATLVLGTLTNGVQQATYTNNGCVRVHDVITAAIGTSSQTIGVDVSSANIGTIKFTSSSSNGTSIVLKGSGGLGRSETATLVYQVVDQNGNALSGVDVTFTPSGASGGLSVSPTKATTDATGSVSTIVSSGTIPAPVTVVATATRNGVTVSGSSSGLTVSTGLPIQKNMSISADKVNIEGDAYDGELSHITILMADQYGNPVSDNAVVNFVTSGGAVGTSAQGACSSVGGACSVDLRSQNFRPTNGRVTVLAYTQGVEDFTDANGDGQYSCTNFTSTTGGAYRPLVDTCVSGGELFVDQGDPFLDADANGVYNAAAGDQPFPYNHTTYSATGDGKWGANYIRKSITITFSGSTAYMTRQVCTNGAPPCRDWTSADGDPRVVTGLSGISCGNQTLSFMLYDRNKNPMPAGTAIAGTDPTNVSIGTIAPATVPSNASDIGGTLHSIIVKPAVPCAAGSFTVTITTPKAIATLFPFTAQ